MVIRLARHLQAAGAAVRTKVRNRKRTITRAVRVVGQALRTRTGEAQVLVAQQTARVLAIIRQVVGQAQRVPRNSRRTVQHQRGRAAAVVQRLRVRLTTMVQRTTQVMVQTEQRMQGETSILERVVSIFDPEARPIRRGKLSAKTEFGYEAVLTESEDRLITHYAVHVGNPGDSDLLAPAFDGHVQAVSKCPAP